MRIKKNIYDILKEKENDYWEEDSKYSHWKDYYIPFYENRLGGILDLELDKLTYDNNRIVAKAKKGIGKIEGYTFGGDVIININNMTEEYKCFFDENSKYNECNLGILPKEGNLQGAKKKIGNDWRFDKFLKAINNYYLNGDREIIYKANNRNNSALTKNVLDFFFNGIIDTIDEDKTEKNPKIYNFTNALYGISSEMTDKFLDCKEDIGPEDFYNLILDFWKERDINRLQKN